MESVDVVLYQVVYVSWITGFKWINVTLQEPMTFNLGKDCIPEKQIFNIMHIPFDIVNFHFSS